MNPSTPIVSRTTLLTVSIIADLIDLVGLGLAPGPWSLIIDAPVTALHFLYAGPKALVVLAEYIPGVGMLPCYTLAALFYYKQPAATPVPAPVRTVTADAAPPRQSRPPVTRPILMTEEVIPLKPASTGDAARKSSTEERLHKLAELRQRGLITDEELAEKKRQILAEL